MWSEHRADSARRALEALADVPLDADDFQTEVAAVVGRVVPHDASCWAPVDPDSGVITGQVTLHFDPDPDQQRRFAEIEAAGDDLHTFSELTASLTRVARLSDAGRTALSSSPRLADIYRPLGFGPELRATFTTDSRCWGVAGLLRSAHSTDYTDDEVAFLGSVAPLIARGLRRAAITGRLLDTPASGPAVIILGGDGDVAAATPNAAARLEALTGRSDAVRSPVVQSVVAAVRVHDIDQARARVRDRAGAWVTVTASPMRTAGGEPQIALTLEPASAAELTDLRLAAHGLSAREIDVCREVLAGRSTSEIALALSISTNTVQDHLKSIFEKTDVHSRRELVAELQG
ncbi:MAG: helix-turn-helix transcriptional regulator [Aquihabitans sp.]